MLHFGVIAALTGADLCLKEYFERQPAEDFPKDLACSKGRVRLYRNHNAGFPFGFLKEHREMVRQVPLILTSAIGGALAFLSLRTGNRIEKAGLTLAFSGALSNLIERLTRGYVVDYFSIRKGKLKNVVMNLGDVFIFTGGVILVLKEMADAIKNR